MQTLKNITILIAALFISTAVFAQNDDSDASHNVDVKWSDLMIMDIENATSSDNTINLEVDYGQHEAGEGISDNTVLASDESTYLNWTVFAPTSNGKKYRISAKVGNSITNNWSLRATPTVESVQSGSAVADAAKDLTPTDQTIVKDISNLSWSGDGSNKGCKIKYDVVVDDADAINASDETINVTYTISAQ
jgi:hypothetical protein